MNARLNVVRPLVLDFEARGGELRAGRWVLALGVTLALACVARWWEVEDERSGWTLKVNDLQRLTQRKFNRIDERPADAKVLGLEIQRANAILGQMTVPWDDLFRDLESAAGDEVALLSVQPDAASRQVRIGGEAKHAAAMFAYIARLEEHPSLARVFLFTHELKPAGGQLPVAFMLVADWVAGS